MQKYLILFCFIFIVSLNVNAQQRISFRDEGGERTYKSSDSFSSYEIKYKGKITLTQDEGGIAAISPNGYFKVSKTTFGNKRAVIIESDRDGKLDYQFYIGRKETVFSDEGKEWLADIMPDVLLKTGIGAEERVTRFYAEGGLNKVLGVISSIESSSIKGLYFEALMMQPLKKGEAGIVAKKIGYSISSSSEQGRLFRKYAPQFLANEASIAPFFDGVSRISSSSETGSVLRSILKNNKLSINTLSALLGATDHISSSSERGSILREVNKVFVNNEAFTSAYFSAFNKISSSSEKGSVLRDLLSKTTLNAYSMRLLLKNAGIISSSSEQGAVLRSAIEKGLHNNQEVQNAFFDAVNIISSSSEKGSVLRKLLTESELTATSEALVFKSIKMIGSSSEMGATLRKSFHLLGENEATSKAFFDAVKSVDSSSEKGSVLSELMGRKENLSANVLLGLLEATKTISSSSEKSNVLMKVAKVLPKDNAQIKEAFKSAARTISSDSEYRRVMESMF
jgi:predicted transcriptional regulator